MGAKLGKELDSEKHWDAVGKKYTTDLENKYHTHRLNVINALIPKELYALGKNIFDFGCGDAVLFPQFIKKGANIFGIDPSKEMVLLAHERLKQAGYDTNLVSRGGVEDIKQIKDKTQDAAICFNVLAYLSDAEETQFYREMSRIIKPGGYLIVTHSNELFDMFSLNEYTVEFFNKHLLLDKTHKEQFASLLKFSTSDKARTLYNIRENPLAYKYKLAKWGFREIQQEFIHLHPLPPALIHDKKYQDTLQFSEENRWILMFICSTFGSCSIRN